MNDYWKRAVIKHYNETHKGMSQVMVMQAFVIMFPVDDYVFFLGHCAEKVLHSAILKPFATVVNFSPIKNSFKLVIFSGKKVRKIKAALTNRGIHIIVVEKHPYL